MIRDHVQLMVFSTVPFPQRGDQRLSYDASLLTPGF